MEATEMEKTRVREILADEPAPRITENAMKVLERRYLAKAEDGRTIVETPAELFWRVAWNLAQAELNYGASEVEVEEVARRFYRLMANLEFLPNSPTLMNAGRELQQLSACFVLPVGDSIPQIFEAVKHQAIIHKTGGGTGFSFSQIRPKNDLVASTSGIASGPISFMKIFNTATEQVKQGGTRRGANMAILKVDHPDILDFIDMKMDLSEMTNFNVSVAITDEFMEAVKKGGKYHLRNPRDQSPVGELDAREVMDKIASNAWTSAEPGLFFIDRANATNPVPHKGAIEATNPCGEQDLLPYDSCNLGSIVLDKHLREVGEGRYEVDWEHLRESIHTSVRFLDNVIDMNNYPLQEIEDMSKGTRRIGLGIMGFARMLFKLEIAYDSEEGLDMARQVMGFIKDEAVKASEALAETRGPYGFWEGSRHQQEGLTPRRNAYVTTIAPTGTISMIADTSGGCEPEFSLIWFKNVMDGTHLPYVLEHFMEVAKLEGFHYDNLKKDILSDKTSTGKPKFPGSCRGLDKVPERWQRVFAVSADVTPEWHVKMQAAFQEHVDAAVSKTINMPKSTTVDDVKRAYLLAYDTGCKGITVYRDGSRQDQVLNVGESKKEGAKTEVEAAEARKQKQVVGATPAGKVVLKPRARPDVVVGTTQKIQTGYGTLYVTINEDENGPIELFATLGKSGGYTASFTEAVSRMVSLSLRARIDPKTVVKQLEGIRSPKGTLDRRDKVLSVPDGIALALKRFVNGQLERSIQARLDSVGLVGAGEAEKKVAALDDFEADFETASEEDAIQALIDRGDNPECPDCGNVLSLQEGCIKCLSCGFSEC